MDSVTLYCIVLICISVLQDFPKSPRSPVVATEYQWASIECNPPKHYPGMICSIETSVRDHYRTYRVAYEHEKYHRSARFEAIS